jgi:hypothetical protein
VIFFSGFIHGVTTMIRDDGISGIYKGLAPTVLRQAANSAVRFTVYDTVKAALVARKVAGPDGKKPKVWPSLPSFH